MTGIEYDYYDDERDIPKIVPPRLGVLALVLLMLILGIVSWFKL